MNTAETVYRSLLPVLDSYRQQGCTRAQLQIAQSALYDFLSHDMLGTVSIDDKKTIRLHMSGTYSHSTESKLIVFSIPCSGEISMFVNGEEAL